MDFNLFVRSLNQDSPKGIDSLYLQALWYDAKGNWEKGHSIVQELNDSTAAWIHAYLHRKEGDAGNAGYWYDRAGRPIPVISLAEEWEQMVKELLKTVI